ISGFQGSCHNIGDAELGAVAVGGPALSCNGLADNIHYFLGHLDAHLPDPIKFRTVVSGNDRGCVSSSMSEMAGRKRFHSDIHKLPNLAKSFGGQLMISLFIEGAEMAFVQAVTTFIRGFRAGESMFGENGSRRRASGCPSGVQALCPGTVIQEREAPGGHAE